MDTRRLALALVAALVIAGGATLFLYLKIRSAGDKPAATIKVVTAAQPLPAGAPIAAESIKLSDWPADIKLEGAHSKTEEVLGRSLIYPINQNQPILDSALAEAGSGIGLTVKIPEGMRAVSVRSNDVTGVAGFLYPGSHVDVVVTSRPEGTNTTLTHTVLQNVEVLTAGQRIEPDPKGKPETVNVVTLLLTPQDGEKLVMATQQGTVQFVLRNGADQGKVETKAVRMDDLIAGAGPKAAAKVAAKKAAKVTPPTDFYEVETIAAGRRAVDKFAETKTPVVKQ